ncbi:MAG: hypothetical protein WA964_01940, partial [Ilumatobacter sp.]|uniref:hypothetical protein n=1 Tax=Ilumatobacter sp. TaxID=1967498 RepID=UPI003C73E1D3
MWRDRARDVLLRPRNIDLRTDEFRDLVKRSREVVLLAAVTGALTGVLVRYFEFVVVELMFDNLLHGDWRWG